MKDRNDFKFEVCANSVESCLAAQIGGADRVELCAGIPEGGTTPSFGEIKQARKILSSTHLHVIIRPRGGDFLYSPLELKRMRSDILLAKNLGVDGVVFGCLDEDGMIDERANAMLMEAATGMSVTFHRAFDRCRNPLESMEEIISLGFNRILTSGQQPTALEGVEMLKQLHEKAAGRIVIMAGCGVNESNILDIYNATQVDEYHFSARVEVKSRMKFCNKNVYMGTKGADEDTLAVTSAERVRATIASLVEH